MTLAARGEGERIIAAAIRHDGLVITAPPPARHHTLMHPFFRLTGKRVGPDDQGFITSAGEYVDRRRALQIALRCGQPMIDHPSRHAEQLFSEDLW